MSRFWAYNQILLTLVALAYLVSALLRPSGAPSLRYRMLFTDLGLCSQRHQCIISA